MMSVYEELGETSRRQILAELRSGPKTVNDLCSATGLKQPNVSNHLCRMKSRGILECSRQGRNVFYALASPDIHAIIQAVFSVGPRPGQSCRCDSLAKEFLQAAISGDETAAAEVMGRTFRTEATLVDLYEDLFTPVMRKIGQFSLDGTLNEAQEHAASEVVQRLMAKAVDVHGQTRNAKRFCILGCAPGAWHTIGLRMIADYLRISGWRTMFLGANVPLRSFMTAVIHGSPDMVLVSCGCIQSRDATLELVESLTALRRSGAQFKIGVGGSYAIAQPCEFMDSGADFAGVTLREFVEDVLPRHLPKLVTAAPA
jgi:MerR family transcriptional regulator, light-induced transcriptional regulator